MTDLEGALWAAWEGVGARLRGDPDELRARLARRRSRMYQRPPRACCLAVRACDRRIRAYDAILVPEDAADPREHEGGRVVEHEVVLDAPLLRRLCEPVWIGWPGETADQLSRKLGCHEASLKWLRRNGTLKVRLVKGLDGRRGKPVPVFWSAEALDPAAHGRAAPDPIWGCLWSVHAGALEEDFAQAVRRVPVYRATRPGRPEHFLGWRWACPGCGELVRTLYMPVEKNDWGAYAGLTAAREGAEDGDAGGGGGGGGGGGEVDLGALDEVDRVPEPLRTFACKRCHGVVMFSRAALRWSWNHVVLHLTGGLMYGHEVEMPAWLTPARKVREHRKPRKGGAPRREELTRYLAGTSLKYKEIAAAMGVRPMTVGKEAMMIYRRHGVEGREGLRRKVGGDCRLPNDGGRVTTDK